MTLCLFDLSAIFWANALGGKDPLEGYELTMGRIWQERRNYERLVVCCDSPRSVRKERVASYKSNRTEKPQKAVDALRGLQDRLLEQGVPIAQVDGYEADDVIATLCEQSWPEETVVIGSEKDLLTLLTLGHIKLYGRSGQMDEQHCFEKFGVTPEQMTDWLSLAGDPADGIAGATEVGAGKATKLLKHFGTVDAMLTATDEELLAIKGIGKQSLAGIRSWNREESLALVLLVRDLPLKLWEIL